MPHSEENQGGQMDDFSIFLSFLDTVCPQEKPSQNGGNTSGVPVGDGLEPTESSVPLSDRLAPDAPLDEFLDFLDSLPEPDSLGLLHLEGEKPQDLGCAHHMTSVTTGTCRVSPVKSETEGIQEEWISEWDPRDPCTFQGNELSAGEVMAMQLFLWRFSPDALEPPSGHSTVSTSGSLEMPSTSGPETTASGKKVPSTQDHPVQGDDWKEQGPVPLSAGSDAGYPCPRPCHAGRHKGHHWHRRWKSSLTSSWYDKWSVSLGRPHIQSANFYTSLKTQARASCCKMESVFLRPLRSREQDKKVVTPGRKEVSSVRRVLIEGKVVTPEPFKFEGEHAEHGVFPGTQAPLNHYSRLTRRKGQDQGGVSISNLTRGCRKQQNEDGVDVSGRRVHSLIHGWTKRKGLDKKGTVITPSHQPSFLFHVPVA